MDCEFIYITLGLFEFNLKKNYRNSLELTQTKRINSTKKLNVVKILYQRFQYKSLTLKSDAMAIK